MSTTISNIHDDYVYYTALFATSPAYEIEEVINGEYLLETYPYIRNELNNRKKDIENELKKINKKLFEQKRKLAVMEGQVHAANTSLQYINDLLAKLQNRAAAVYDAGLAA